MFELIRQVLSVANDQAHPMTPPSDELLGRLPKVMRTAIFDQRSQAAPVIGNLACDIDAAPKAVRGVFQDGGIDLQMHQLTANRP